MFDRPRRCFLHRDGQDLLALEQERGVFGLHVAEEGVDCGEPVVSRSRTVARPLRERRQEIPDNLRAQGPQGEMVRRDAELITAVPEQQLEDVAVPLDRVGAGVTRTREMIGEEAGQVDGQVGWLHHRSLLGIAWPTTASTLATTSGNNAGVSRK